MSTDEVRPRVTLRDVAQAAGVSTAAVSFALNGGPGVSMETREKVGRLAAEMGYRPNVSARALVKGRTGLLAVAPSVLPEVASYLAIDYLSEVVSGAIARATALGHPMVVTPAMSTPALWDSLPVDGVVVVDPKSGDQHVIEVLARSIPLVTVDRDPSHPDGWFVDSGVAAGTRAVLDHVREQGGRRVALISWEMEDAFRSDTESAYREWASSRGMPQVVERWPHPRSGIDEERLSALVGRPDVDAVYTVTLPYALAVVEAAAVAGRSVPADLLVASARDLRETSVTVDITTVEFHPQVLGKAAVELLLRRLDGAGLPPLEQRTVPATLSVRTSTQRHGARGSNDTRARNP